jgi:hypothetical protein
MGVADGEIPLRIHFLWDVYKSIDRKDFCRLAVPIASSPALVEVLFTKTFTSLEAPKCHVGAELPGGTIEFLGFCLKMNPNSLNCRAYHAESLVCLLCQVYEKLDEVSDGSSRRQSRVLSMELTS